MGKLKDNNKNYINTQQNGKVHSKPTEKQFIPRNSLLTDLFQTEHINVIYRTFVVALFLLFIRYFFAEYSNGGKITFGTKYIVKGFNNFENLVIFWFFMFSLSTIVYPAFNLWSCVVQSLIAKKTILKLWNTIWLLIVCLYMFLLVYVPIKYGAFTDAMATNACILCEQARFVMKTHAFLRHNCPRILSFKPHSDKDIDGPKFSSFLYYQFAPTIIYRDKYPRTQKINWTRVAMLSLEFMGCIFWSSFLLDSMIERYKYFGLVKETYSSLLLSVMDSMLASPFFLLTGFYILLHVWLNIWSELLTFADRNFYGDWWNSQSFGTYYRKWNLVVHDYLHTYLYRDLIYLTNSKTIATISTFLISLLVHEYIVSLVIGFFLPILGLHFMSTVFIVRLENHKFFNTLLIWGLAIGTSMELCSYSMEYNARVNCPIEDESYWKYFQFRMLSCNGLDL